MSMGPKIHAVPPFQPSRTDHPLTQRHIPGDWKTQNSTRERETEREGEKETKVLSCET
jgi:hypothetical protein